MIRMDNAEQQEEVRKRQKILEQDLQRATQEQKAKLQNAARQEVTEMAAVARKWKVENVTGKVMLPTHTSRYADLTRKTRSLRTFEECVDATMTYDLLNALFIFTNTNLATKHKKSKEVTQTKNGRLYTYTDRRYRPLASHAELKSFIYEIYRRRLAAPRWIRCRP